MSLPQPNANETVLVTGASAGIGVELARELASHGHNLVLVARRLDRLESLATELRAKYGVNVVPIKCDLADDKARKKLIKELSTGERHIVGLCNNAGFGSHGPFIEADSERQLGQVKLNVEALLELTDGFIRPMVARGTGAILNVGSIAGFQPTPNMATYAGTKAFVNSFSEALNAELSGTGVSCTVLCPGPVVTEFSDIAGNKDQEASLPGFVFVAPKEVARLAVEGMLKGKRTVVPGLSSKVASTAGRVSPRSLMLPLMEKFLK